MSDFKLNIIIFLLMGTIIMMAFCTMHILDEVDNNVDNMINACGAVIGNE